MTLLDSGIALPHARVERYETIVIGGGQAGLAMGYHLARRDADFLIVSDEARVGDNWRRRWDSLRLFTPAGYSGLPGMPFPAPPRHLADKDSLRWDGERWVIHTGTSTLEADNVVIATGAFQQPRIPAIARRLSLDIRQLHSSAYRNPLELPDGPVLVAGAGNSGAQIALELARFRKVWLAGRNTGHLPRRVLGRDLFDWIWPVMSRATADTPLGRRLRDRAKGRGDALIGIPERELVRGGVVRVPRVADARGGLPVCGEDTIDARVIIWCTGFAPDYRWIDAPIFDTEGQPRHVRGVATGTPGLFFLGQRFQHRMSSSLIGGVGSDAEFLAERIVERCEALVPG